jgi:hypothetical protein
MTQLNSNINEIQLFSNLEHVNIIRYYSSWIDVDIPSIIEYNINCINNDNDYDNYDDYDDYDDYSYDSDNDDDGDEHIIHFE